jgi:hypothetical protein
MYYNLTKYNPTFLYWNSIYGYLGNRDEYFILNEKYSIEDLKTILNEILICRQKN